MEDKGLVDYREYRFTLKDWLFFLLLLSLISFLFGFLLFNKLFFGFLFALAISFFVYKKQKEKLRLKRIDLLERQFADALQEISASLYAGISFVQAIEEIAYREGPALIKEEFLNISRQLSYNISIEEAFIALSTRSDSKDIINFSNALSSCLYSGGNLIYLVRSASSSLRLKYRSQDEIRSLLNLPKFNHKILISMPFALILLIKIIAPVYIGPLYLGKGRIIMLIVASLLVLSWFIGDRISNISY